MNADDGGGDPLDRLLSPADKAEMAAWDADAYRIVIEVPASKITDTQLDTLYDAINVTVMDWEQGIAGRDWDPVVYGHGPLRRRTI